VITTQAGPESVKTTDLTGASSGDHTHPLVARRRENRCRFVPNYAQFWPVALRPS
jgi:hypothetical protein